MAIPFSAHGNQEYPWDSWTDGKPHLVRRGRHFHIDPESFRRVLGTRARRLRTKVQTRVKGEKVWFQFGGE